MIHWPTWRPPGARRDRRARDAQQREHEERPQHPRNRRVHPRERIARARADREPCDPVKRPGPPHLPMQKREKIDAEQVVGGEFAGDRRERVLRLAQLLGEELERRRGGRELRRARARDARPLRAAPRGGARARGTCPPCPRARPTSARISRRRISTPAPVFADSQTCRVAPSSAGAIDFGSSATRSILLCTTMRGSADGSRASIFRIGRVDPRLGGLRVDHDDRDIGARDRRPGPLDAERLDRILGRAQARRVDHGERYPVNLDLAAHGVARRARDRRHDRDVLTRQLVEKARLADVGAPDQHGHEPFAQQRALRRARKDSADPLRAARRPAPPRRRRARTRCPRRESRARPRPACEAR